MSTVSRYEEVKGRVSLREFAEAHLDHARGGLICPCGSGRGPHGTPAFSLNPDGEHWRCFSCDKGGDVFDLAGYVYGTDDRAEQYRIVCEWAGIEAEGAQGVSSRFPRPAAAVPARREGGERGSGAADYAAGREREREYIERCRGNMSTSCEGVEYMRSRGFSRDEVERFGIGWDGMKRRVVLPWSARPGEWYHIDRAIDHDGGHKYDKPSEARVGPQPVHNVAALDGRAVFVVEGMIDALAVMACGYPAMALMGTSWRRTERAMVECGYSGVVIPMLDSDEAGQRAESELRAALDADGIRTGEAPELPTTSDGSRCKDAGEALAKDRDGLTSALAESWAAALADLEAEEEARYAEAMRRLRAVDPAQAVMDIYALRDYEEPTPTGLAGLDRVLDGGLRRGVYVLGAISSLGKTTLAVQIADHIAASGRPVLFVTIEQSAREIVAKSLSRIIKQRSGKAVKTRSLMSREARAAWGRGETWEAFDAACLEYADTVAPNMRILEGTRQPGVSDVAEAARAMASHDGRAPVVFIDYLQLLAAQSERDTDKQATDKNMMSLRQLARDMRTTVFVISSLNRSSYSGTVSLDSFKESGGIEYGADVLLGLQPYRMGERLEGVSEAKRKTEAAKLMRQHKADAERPSEIVVLKQRNGSTPDGGVPVTFLPVCNLFTDGAGDVPTGARVI